jgi:manganese/zinc/iron transport system ATP- binding protein
MAVTALDVHNLTVHYDAKPVLWNVDFEIPAASIVAIVGPNGAGKSTLLKAMLGLIPVVSGRIAVFGEPLADKRSIIAYVPQRSEVDWDFPITVAGVAEMGRFARRAFYQRLRAVDREAASAALQRVGMTDFRDRQIRQLSGGQQQRVFLARALAQDAALYILDEPFAGIDAGTEASMVSIFRELSAQGKTVVCVHHDLSTIAEYFTHVVLLNQRIIAHGPVNEVFTSSNLKATYGSSLGLLTDVADSFERAGRV